MKFKIVESEIKKEDVPVEINLQILLDNDVILTANGINVLYISQDDTIQLSKLFSKDLKKLGFETEDDHVKIVNL